MRLRTLLICTTVLAALALISFTPLLRVPRAEAADFYDSTVSVSGTSAVSGALEAGAQYAARCTVASYYRACSTSTCTAVTTDQLINAGEVFDIPLPGTTGYLAFVTGGSSGSCYIYRVRLAFGGAQRRGLRGGEPGATGSFSGGVTAASINATTAQAATAILGTVDAGNTVVNGYLGVTGAVSGDTLTATKATANAVTIQVPSTGKISFDGAAGKPTATFDGSNFKIDASKTSTTDIILIVGSATRVVNTNGYFQGAGGVQIGASGQRIDDSYAGTFSIDFAGVTDSCEDSAEQTLANAAVYDVCVVGPPAALPSVTSWVTCWVSSAGKVTFRHCAHGASGNPAAANYSARVFDP